MPSPPRSRTPSDEEWRPDEPGPQAPPVAPPSPGRAADEPRSLRYHDLAGARPQPAGRVLAIGALALLIAALLNIDGLADLANRQPLGWKRDVARVAVAPFCAVGRVTRIRDARTAIRDAADKETQPCEDDPASGEGAFRADLITTTTAASQTTGPPVTTRDVTADAPLRTFVGGDSMAIELANSVETAVAGRSEIALTTNARVSTGLTRPDFYDWPAYFADELLPTEPEVTVVMFGANDSQGMLIDGNPYQPSSPEWQAEYRRRVAFVMDQLRGEGRLVVWVGQPHMRDGGFDERMGVLNAIYAEEAESRPWVRFLDSRPVLSPDGDGYQVEAGGTTLRSPDGIHLSRAGSDALAAAVLDLVADEAGLAPPG